ncbi:MAG: VOC family protein [Planctomycetota bacterium]|jgi:catechol-2,3-dioxygenase
MENLTLGAETRTIVERLEHAHLSTANLERALDFYRRAFGLKVRFREVGPHGPCAHVGTDRFYLALTEKPGLKPAAACEGHATIYHLGLVTSDAAALKDRLDREGFDVTWDVSRPEGRALYVNDPDGHEIEVVEYVAGYAYR